MNRLKQTRRQRNMLRGYFLKEGKEDYLQDWDEHILYTYNKHGQMKIRKPIQQMVRKLKPFTVTLRNMYIKHKRLQVHSSFWSMK